MTKARNIFMPDRKSIKDETLISYKKFVKVEILISYIRNWQVDRKKSTRLQKTKLGFKEWQNSVHVVVE